VSWNKTPSTRHIASLTSNPLPRSDYKRFLRDYYDTQTQTWENNGKGWIYWTWKTENAAEWSYQAGLAGGWIPYNPGEHLDYKCS